LICPVDHPLISATTLRALAAALAGSLNAPREARHMVFLPVHGGRRGHPVCISRHLIDEVLALPAGATLRDATLKDPARIADVHVDDPWVLKDLDRPEDYESALQSLQGG
jgi:CTP:molybdopterin cytidylyltransferase MocA